MTPEEILIKKQNTCFSRFTEYVSLIGNFSNPPPGKYKVTNIYVDPDTNKLVVEYENTLL